MVELQVDQILGNTVDLNFYEIPENNMFFRDIDDLPWYTEDINILHSTLVN